MMKAFLSVQHTLQAFGFRVGPLTTDARISLRRGLELARMTLLPASLLNSGVLSANDVTGSGLEVDIAADSSGSSGGDGEES